MLKRIKSGYVNKIQLISILLIPILYYASLQSSSIFFRNQINSVYNQSAVDIAMKIDTTNAAEIKEDINNILVNSNLITSYTVLETIKFHLNISNELVAIYACDFNKFFINPRLRNKFHGMDLDSYSQYNDTQIIMSRDLANSWNCEIGDFVDLNGTIVSFGINSTYNFGYYQLGDISNYRNYDYQITIEGPDDTILTYPVGSLFSVSEAAFWEEYYMIINFNQDNNEVAFILQENLSKLSLFNVIFDGIEEKRNIPRYFRQIIRISENVNQYVEELILSDISYLQYVNLYTYTADFVTNFNLSILVSNIFIILASIPLPIFLLLYFQSSSRSFLESQEENIKLLYVRGMNLNRICLFQGFKILKPIVSSTLPAFLLGELGMIVFFNKFLDVTNTPESYFISLSNSLTNFTTFLMYEVISLLVAFLIFYVTFRLHFAKIVKDQSANNEESSKLLSRNRNKWLNLSLVLITSLIFIVFPILFFTVFRKMDIYTEYQPIRTLFEILLLIVTILSPIVLIFLFSWIVVFSITEISEIKKRNSIKKNTKTRTDYKIFRTSNHRQKLTTSVFLLSFILSFFLMSNIIYTNQKITNFEISINQVGGDFSISVAHTPNSSEIDSQIRPILEELDVVFTNLFILDSFLILENSGLENNSFFYGRTIQPDISGINVTEYQQIHEGKNPSDELTSLSKLVTNNSILIHEDLNQEFGFQIGTEFNLTSNVINVTLTVAGTYSNLPGISDNVLNFVINSDLSVIFTHQITNDLEENLQIKMMCYFENNKFSNQELINFLEITDLYKDGRISVSTSQEIYENLNNPCFDFALYSVITSHLRIESVMYVIIGFVYLIVLTGNLIEKNKINISLFLVRGFRITKIARYIDEFYFSLFSSCVPLSLIGLSNAIFLQSSYEFIYYKRFFHFFSISTTLVTIIWLAVIILITIMIPFITTRLLLKFMQDGASLTENVKRNNFL